MSLFEIILNFNHSKCVLTVVIKLTLPHIQRTRHQFDIQKYHILKLGWWKNSGLAKTSLITERASKNAFKTFRLINSSLISPLQSQYLATFRQYFLHSPAAHLSVQLYFGLNYFSFQFYQFFPHIFCSIIT
jgi:hypothetical protein